MTMLPECCRQPNALRATAAANHQINTVRKQRGLFFAIAAPFIRPANLPTVAAQAVLVPALLPDAAICAIGSFADLTRKTLANNSGKLLTTPYNREKVCRIKYLRNQQPRCVFGALSVHNRCNRMLKTDAGAALKPPPVKCTCLLANWCRSRRSSRSSRPRSGAGEWWVPP
ncbi:hypothetical protein HNQ38_000701 [Desulfovibrio intestinalis]|uniref:Uncharacterized protein n=1 Tax=Desulfovibrio intestinalis TaxID=58621 RepID=A0A7W8FGB0_9BACT|nr:hypothetical protein [Desulfovibrio intestinalis]